MYKRNDLTSLIYLVRIVYPKYEVHCFIIYMIKNYCNILKQQQLYTLRGVSTDFMIKFNGKGVLWDPDNTIIVNNPSEENMVKIIHVILPNTTIRRKVYVISKQFESPNTVLATYNLLYNLNNATTCRLQKCKEETSFQFADEIDLSLISTTSDWSDSIIRICLQKFFEIPKLLYSGDLIAVDLKNCVEVFFQSHRMKHVHNTIYFKCNKIKFQEKSVKGGFLCATDRLTVKQSSTVQGFIPKLDLVCPQGLDSYLRLIVNMIQPFMQSKELSFLPVFLITGPAGSGKRELLHCVASELGMNMYQINNNDLSANVYAQNETKLKKCFFNAKIAAPVIIQIKNFENFGKNHEGEYDERLITYFKNELKTLFIGNKFPVILFCCANDRNIPTELKRIFLKIIEIKAPDFSEREGMLNWIFDSMNIKSDIEISTLANKTHGFFFEDLRSFIQKSVTDFHRNKTDLAYIPAQYFTNTLNVMQSSHHESLGAPSVPQIKWEDVGGLNDVKDEIIKTIKLPLEHKSLLKSNNLGRSGILLFGPPGTGKTLIAKAVATECGLCFLSVKGPELLNMYVGQSEQNVRRVFEKARDASPCIIFFDELDSLAPNRGSSGDSGGVMDRVVSQLLAEMDGLGDSGKVFIIGATNRPDLIDPALLRPGRIDKMLYVGPCCDHDSKAAVLTALTRNFHLSGENIIDAVVSSSPDNFSGADFYGVCSGAWMSAVRNHISAIENGANGRKRNQLSADDIRVTFDDFKAAIDKVKPSLTKRDMEYFRKLQIEWSSQ